MKKKDIKLSAIRQFDIQDPDQMLDALLGVNEKLNEVIMYLNDLGKACNCTITDFATRNGWHKPECVNRKGR